MKVITRNKILVNPDRSYSYVDGSSSSEEILTTQKIINVIISEKEKQSGGAPTGFRRPIENGVWDDVTAMWYNSEKTRIDSELNKLKMFLGGVVASTAGSKSSSKMKQSGNTPEMERFFKLLESAQKQQVELEKAKIEADKAKAEANTLKAQKEMADKKASWWKNRTKTQKALIIGGALAITGLTVFLIIRSSRKAKTAVTA